MAKTHFLHNTYWSLCGLYFNNFDRCYPIVTENIQKVTCCNCLRVAGLRGMDFGSWIDLSKIGFMTYLPVDGNHMKVVITTKPLTKDEVEVLVDLMLEKAEAFLPTAKTEG
jgi:hypothetical protein